MFLFWIGAVGVEVGAAKIVNGHNHTPHSNRVAVNVNANSPLNGINGSSEVFFRNITQILDHLLKDYDSSQHPNYREGE